MISCNNNISIVSHEHCVDGEIPPMCRVLLCRAFEDGVNAPSGRWEIASNKDGIMLRKALINNRVVRHAVCEVNESPRRLAEYLWPLQHRELWDSRIVCTQNLNPLDNTPHQQTSYLLYSSGSTFVQDREFIIQRSFAEVRGIVVIAEASISDHASVPPPVAVVRAHMGTSGFVLQPHADSPSISNVHLFVDATVGSLFQFESALNPIPILQHIRSKYPKTSIDSASDEGHQHRTWQPMKDEAMGKGEWGTELGDSRDEMHITPLDIDMNGCTIL